MAYRKRMSIGGIPGREKEVGGYGGFGGGSSVSGSANRSSGQNFGAGNRLGSAGRDGGGGTGRQKAQGRTMRPQEAKQAFKRKTTPVSSKDNNRNMFQEYYAHDVTTDISKTKNYPRVNRSLKGDRINSGKDQRRIGGKNQARVMKKGGSVKLKKGK